MAEPLCRRIHELVGRIIASAGCGLEEGEALEAVEIIGGGTRIPCVARAIAEGAGGAPLSKTLDSNTALCLGAWASAYTRFPSPQEQGDEPQPATGAMDAALAEMGQAGMGEVALGGQRGVFEGVQAEQARQKEAEHASNALASLLSGVLNEPYNTHKEPYISPERDLLMLLRRSDMAKRARFFLPAKEPCYTHSDRKSALMAAAFKDAENSSKSIKREACITSKRALYCP